MVDTNANTNTNTSPDDEADGGGAPPAPGLAPDELARYATGVPGTDVSDFEILPGEGLHRKRLTLNMGPQHPSTHGVLRVVLDLDGENVIDARPIVGYLHRGTEKIAEGERYNQIVPYTDRLDYVAAPSNNLAYVMAVEKLLGIEVPERCQYMRVMFGELARITSHLLWLGTHAMDVGAISVFLYCMRERELILDLYESFAGARLTTSLMSVGGMPYDLPDGWTDNLRHFLKIFPNRITEYETLLTENPIWQHRTRGIGLLTAEQAISYSMTGPCLRGSGVNFDLRKAFPYLVYDRFDFDVPLGVHGDVYDRYLVRMAELRQSHRILTQALAQLPGGPVNADAPHIVWPEKDATMTTIEAMTRHFMIAVHGFKAPPGQVYSSIEGPKGELGFYLVSDGGNTPYRLHIRAPSFINLAALPVMSKGGLVADVVAIIGSIDIVLGETDR